MVFAAVTTRGMPLLQALAGNVTEDAELEDGAEARRFQAKRAKRALSVHDMPQGVPGPLAKAMTALSSGAAECLGQCPAFRFAILKFYLARLLFKDG